MKHHHKHHQTPKRILWKSITLALITLLVIGIIIGININDKTNNSEASTTPETGELSAEITSFDFGRISMTDGTVNREINIKNTGVFPAIATKLSTSCMCTVVELTYQKKTEGPFGMPGHGFVPSINTIIQPGDGATIKVTFDPTAHGPAGVGAITREVYLEQKDGKRLTIKFSAFVTP